GQLYTFVYEPWGGDGYSWLVRSTFTNSLTWISGLESCTALAFDPFSYLYYAGSSGNIVMITPSGNVLPFATVPGGAAGLAFDPTSGNLFATTGSNVVKITAQGNVSTFASLQGSGTSLAIDSRGNLYTETSIG